MSFLEHIPRRIIFLLLALIIAVPILRPFPVLVPTSDHTHNYYNAIENLKPGTVVFIGASVSTRDLELYPQHIATLKHLKQVGAKIIMYHFEAGAAMGTEWVFTDAGYDPSTYGVDHVNLGFLPGEDATLSAWCQDIIATKTVDHYGNLLDKMPMFQDIKSIDDIDLVIGSGGGTPGADNYARIIVIPYNKDALVMVPGAFAARMYDYIALGVYDGGLIAQRGAVEYESLTGFAGRATAMYAPLLISSIALLILMVGGNIVFLYDIRRKGAHR